jgi:hypothetical protein
MFDVRCSMFDVRCSMFDVGCSMLDVRRTGSSLISLVSTDETRNGTASESPFNPAESSRTKTLCPSSRKPSALFPSSETSRTELFSKSKSAGIHPVELRAGVALYGQHVTKNSQRNVTKQIACTMRRQGAASQTGPSHRRNRRNHPRCLVARFEKNVAGRTLRAARARKPLRRSGTSGFGERRTGKNQSARIIQTRLQVPWPWR